MEYQFQCPVCYDIPEKEIYQCENGHQLCSRCYKLVKQCPQCRSEFREENIRAKDLEVALDSMSFSCPAEESGCKEKLKRNEIGKHLEGCSFASRLTPLCSLLGYKCGFKTNVFQLPSALTHFQCSHKFLLAKESVNMNLRNFETKPSLQTCIWTPVLIIWEEDVDDILGFLVVPKINEDKSVSFICFFLGDPVKRQEREFKVDFQIESSGIEKIPDITWSISPVSLLHVKALLYQYPLRFPAKILQQYGSNESLKVRVGVTKRSPQQDNIGAPTMELVPHQMKLPRKEKSEVFYGIRCDSCDTIPLIQARYKCLQCANFDLCQECMDRNIHSHHVFAIVKSKQQNETIRQATMDLKVFDWKPLIPEMENSDPSSTSEQETDSDSD